uniref:Uncharacterized protein n=1 Tax=Hucho hucho TaxID=62062 RepID=A0A4W5LMK0_9TELE
LHKVLCCCWIRHHYGNLSTEHLSLLDQMGGDITKQIAPFEDKVRFLNETIYQIKKLFDGNMKAVTWDKKNLDYFLNILEHQFENLNSCQGSPNLFMENYRRLKQYFKKLNRKVLRKMNYSAQAWELIRKGTQCHLQRLGILAGQMY